MATLTFQQMQSALLQAGWQDVFITTRADGRISLIALMAAIGMAESSGQTDAYNPYGRDDSYGIWQINRKAHPQFSPSELLEPVGNARAALDVYKRQGLTAWSTYTYGKYKKFLADSQATYSRNQNVMTEVPTTTEQTSNTGIVIAGLILIFYCWIKDPYEFRFS